MPVIRVRENEPFDVALRRFKRKRAKASAIKRHAKKMARENARRTRLY